MTKTTEAVAEERVRELRDQKQAHFDAGYTRNLENNDVLSICSELLTSRQQIGELRKALRELVEVQFNWNSRLPEHMRRSAVDKAWNTARNLAGAP